MAKNLFWPSRVGRVFIASSSGLLILLAWPWLTAQASSPLPQPVAPLRSPPPQNTVSAPVPPLALPMGHPTQGVALHVERPNTDPNDQPGPRVTNSLVLRRFDDALFRAAQTSGRPILLVFSKADCPGCTLQVPSLQRVLKEDEFKAVEVFQVDFINQRELAQRFNIQGWSVILGFKGTEYRVRMQGLNRPSDLRKEIRKLLK